MKVPYSWLREWVDLPWEAGELGSRLTMAGFELESLVPAAPEFTGVVVAEILEAVPHPQADKLRVCKVHAGGEPLQIVCGAPNARAGLRTALATVGASLPGNLMISAARLRGVESAGMLCSARELGLSEAHEGIIEFPADAPVGQAVREYLGLEDHVLELNVTPNRGDALSILGVAREVSALTGGMILGPQQVTAVQARIDDRLPVTLAAPQACPRLVGRVVRGIDNTVRSPVWMRERLRRAGVRSISPSVDVTNYVLLELGQPMHAYDLGRVQGGLSARQAAADEAMTLLDGREVKLDPDMLVIADGAGPVGVAGIMGGERTAVSTATTDIFFEAAYFAPAAIAGRARRLGLHTDASQRFERGVDPSEQERAIERATALLLSITGGVPGPMVVTEDRAHLSQRPSVRLRRESLWRLLGVGIDDVRVMQILRALQMDVSLLPEGWAVTPPPHRFDIAIEADLVEEVARIEGFGAIPEQPASSDQVFLPFREAQAPERVVLEALVARGWHESINFAFTDPVLQTKLFPGVETLALSNAIASDLSAMRVSLWPGLLKAALENQRRQADRIRLFEHGTRFVVSKGAVVEVDSLAGLASGRRAPEQWGLDAKAAVDFYDVKADVEALLAATAHVEAFTFEAAQLPLLHPGRTARMLRDGAPRGWLGELHPRLVRELGFTQAPVLFELDFEALQVRLPAGREISRFPQVRRDLAVVLPEAVTFNALRECVASAGSGLLRTLRLFDVYRGPGVESGRKSVALGLIFQDIARTLTDEDVDGAVAAIVAALQIHLDASIRE